MSTIDRVKRVFAEHRGMEHGAISPATTLFDLNVDSLESVELLILCEQEFGVEIEDDDFFKADTVADIAKVIDGLVS